MMKKKKKRKTLKNKIQKIFSNDHWLEFQESMKNKKILTNMEVESQLFTNLTQKVSQLYSLAIVFKNSVNGKNI